MIQKIITTLFYLLFFLTPLLWAPRNYELFEYNKMMFVYFLTIIITASWIIKMINSKTLIFKTTPLDLPLLIFLLANILSTIFSIDPHTSLWGYYSRSNGGLLSTIAYIILYYALVSNFSASEALKFLKAAVFGGVVVALWAIPEHFGVSPSCLLLTGQADASCWVQNVQSRVFATLGQPNWLAAYLAMLIFPSVYFALTAPKKSSQILYALYSVLLYLAFTFTYSRGGTLGFLAGAGVFLGAFLYQTLRLHPGGGKLNLQKPLIIIVSIFIFTNLLFGSALTSFKLLSKFAPPPRETISLTPAPTTGTQLENGGTESGQIRLIVWKGALEIFKAYPLFGSGVETFAYAYYQYRPVEHNLISEWDFLYNKAHNEFLNYLTTTGLAGFLSYMTIILAFIVWSIKKILESSHKNQESSKFIPDSRLLALVTLSSYLSYLVQNIFGFSVVIIALFFYFFPAIVFLATDSTKPLRAPPLIHFIYRRPLYPKLAKFFIIIFAGLFLLRIITYYKADTIFAQGNRINEQGNPGRAYNLLTTAVELNPGEPLYQSELGYAAAAAALALSTEDATLSAQLKDQAIRETDQVLQNNPKNTSLFRTAIRTYYLLSNLDKKYNGQTLQIMDQTIQMAPTDAKLLYNKAIILDQQKKTSEAIETLLATLKIKPNYKEAYLSLGEIYFEQGEKEKALEEAQAVLKLIPGDPETLEKLAEWEK